MARILVGVAWPYANGPLHLGHVAGSLLPPDIFARYHRMRGNEVLMVSGSDEHGTPITVEAEKRGVTPQALVDQYHAQHKEVLQQLGISFDLFTRTSSDHHKQHVQEIVRTLVDRGLIHEDTMVAPYDPAAKRFLPDRYVEGTCPKCQKEGARGDQCDRCGATLDPKDLIEPRSKLTPGTRIEFRDTRHLFFRLSAFQGRLQEWFDAKPHWRPNVRDFTRNWLAEGLKDRAITRDLTWGVPVPVKGYEQKRLYVWFEAVCGYYTASVLWAREVAKDPERWRDFWEEGRGDDVRHYYFLAKDNIPFHTIIWPAILMAYGDGREARGQARLRLPFDVPANEYLTMGGLQFSKSRGVGIWVHEILARFSVDHVRYYLAAAMPERRDSDWAWDDFLSKANGELVANLGNFIHRVVSLTGQHFKGLAPPAGVPTGKEHAVELRITEAHAAAASHLEACRFKDALAAAMDLARYGNKLVDELQPWRLVREDRERAAGAMTLLLRVVRALNVMMWPFVPHAAERLWRMTGGAEAPRWDQALEPIGEGSKLQDIAPLFPRLEPDEVLALAKPAPASQKAAGATPEATTMTTIPIEDFQKVELRVGKVLEVQNHPKADKLYVLRVDVGGEVRTIVTGLRGQVPPQDLQGKTIVVVANLQPATIRGVESRGMLLAAEVDKDVWVVQAPGAPSGAKVR